MSVVSKRNKARKKQSHKDIIGPALLLNQSSASQIQHLPSYADLYPRASAETKVSKAYIY